MTINLQISLSSGILGKPWPPKEQNYGPIKRNVLHPQIASLFSAAIDGAVNARNDTFDRSTNLITMKIKQSKWTPDGGWSHTHDSIGDGEAHFALVFGGRHTLEKMEPGELKSAFPGATLVSCSTSGEICDIEVSDDTLVATAVQLERSQVKVATAIINDTSESHEMAAKLAGELSSDDLKHILVISDGLKVNGSQLVKGFNDHLPESVKVTGGLAGDAARFEKTMVGLNGEHQEGLIVALGFYGDIKVSASSKGGWDPFGPERIVTKSKDNVLYELDDQSALDLYKTYLGDKADGLPGTGLLFPLNIREAPGANPVVRTLLAVDEAAHSMTFAGDIPEGSTARLMKASFDKLIDGAFDAAEQTMENDPEPQLAILVSCVGRKLILSQRIEEEVEEIRDVYGDDTIITGFYSYGEISPQSAEVNCELLNQTMTITTLSEA